jgi:hypothetical protein
MNTMFRPAARVFAMQDCYLMIAIQQTFDNRCSSGACAADSECFIMGRLLNSGDVFGARLTSVEEAVAAHQLVRIVFIMHFPDSLKLNRNCVIRIQ